MDLVLQIWGGGCYLLNKIFFAFGEGRPAAASRRLKLTGWALYLLGVPAWVFILMAKHNWIAAAIEAGGVPSMLLGLIVIWRQQSAPPRLLDNAAALTTYAALILGLGYSLYDYGGLRTLSQLFEIGVMLGFLLGSYLLAKQQRNGWLFFMLMNLSMASLMGLQQKPLLCLQQLASLGFVVYGYLKSSPTAARD